MQPTPNEQAVVLDSQIAARVLAALGIHGSLLDPKATAGALREARRQAQVDLVEPLAALTARAASDALDTDVRITWPLRSDVQLVAARTVHALQQAGGDVAVGRQVAGI